MKKDLLDQMYEERLLHQEYKNDQNFWIWAHKTTLLENKLKKKRIKRANKIENIYG